MKNAFDLLKRYGWPVHPSRWSVFDMALEMTGHGNLFVVEVGLAVDVGDGLSTLRWASSEKVSKILSIELNQNIIGRFDERFPDLKDVLTIFRGHSLQALSSLPNDSVDLLYLDGDGDPRGMLHEFIVSIPKLRAGAVVVCDDFKTKCGDLHRFIAGDEIPLTFTPYGRFVAGIRTTDLQIIEPDCTFGMMVFRYLSVSGWGITGASGA